MNSEEKKTENAISDAVEDLNESKVDGIAEEAAESKADETPEEAAESKADEAPEEAAENKADEAPEEAADNKADEAPEEATESKADETEGEKSGERFEKKKKRKKIRSGLSAKTGGIAAGVMILVCGAMIGVMSQVPYAVSIDGQEICRVGSRESADKAIAGAVNAMAVEGTEVKAVNSEKKIKVERTNTIGKSDVVSAKKAAGLIGDALTAEPEDDFTSKSITVVSTKIAEKEFTPKPEYVKDESMVAGTSETVEESKNGRGMCLYTYTTVNGKLEADDEEIIEVLDEGKSAVIKKGTIGLPEGEDWETYEGDPVFSSGAALVATAKKYKGAPYKWGGTNLQTGVSCIGFVKAIYKKYGIKIPMSHSLLKQFGVGVAYKNAQPGDIICYKEHTGIYIGGGKMIDAASNRGVGIANVRSGNVVTVRRVPRS